MGRATSSSGVAVSFDLGTPVDERRGVEVANDAPSTIPERGLICGSVGAEIGAYARWVGVASSVAVANDAVFGVRV